MPIILAVILGLGSFIGYTLNDIDNQRQAVLSEQAPASNVVLDLQCHDPFSAENKAPKQ